MRGLSRRGGTKERGRRQQCCVATSSTSARYLQCLACEVARNTEKAQRRGGPGQENRTGPASPPRARRKMGKCWPKSLWMRSCVIFHLPLPRPFFTLFDRSFTWSPVSKDHCRRVAALSCHAIPPRANNLFPPFYLFFFTARRSAMPHVRE